MSDLSVTDDEVARLTHLFRGFDGGFFDSGTTAYVAAEPGVVDQRMAEHFRGERDIGIYCMAQSWGCVDIDVDVFSDAVAVAEILRALHLKPWVEASRSKGFHVWVFLPDEIQDRRTNVRLVLKEAVHSAGLPENTEVNPKQTKDTTKGIGNCVRLPYGRWAREHPGRMTMVLSPDGEYRQFSPTEFLDLAERGEPEAWASAIKVASRRVGARKQASELNAKLKSLSGPDAPWGRPQGEKSGGTDQEAWRVLTGLSTCPEGQRNNTAFTMAMLLHGRGTPLVAAETAFIPAVVNGFQDGSAFLDEALTILRRVYTNGR